MLYEALAMNPAEALRNTARRLRESVAAGEYSQAQEDLAAHCRSLEQTISGPPEDDSELLELARETRECFEWARRMALAARASLAGQVEALPSAGPYRASATGARTWDVEG